MQIIILLSCFILISFTTFGVETKNQTPYLNNYIGFSIYPGISNLSKSEKKIIKDENNYDNKVDYRHYESINVDLFYKTLLNSRNYLDYSCRYTFATPYYKNNNTLNNDFPNIKIYSTGIYHTFILYEGRYNDATSFLDNTPIKSCSNFGLKYGPTIGNIYYGKYSHSVLGFQVGLTLMRFFKYNDEGFILRSNIMDIGLYYDYFHDYRLSSKFSYSQFSIVFASSGF